MCEFYNTNTENFRFQPKINNEPRLMRLKRGDIISLPISRYSKNIFIMQIACGDDFKYIERKWTYKKKLFNLLKLPHWRIFGVYMDIFEYVGA